MSRHKNKVVEYGHIPREESSDRPGQGSQVTPGPEPFYLTTPPTVAYGELVSATPSRKGQTIRMEYVCRTSNTMDIVSTKCAYRCFQLNPLSLTEVYWH